MRPGLDAAPVEPIVIRPPRKNGILLGLAALVPAALFGALTLRSWNAGRTGAAGIVVGALVTLVAILVAAYLVARALRARILVHETGLERVGVFRRHVVGWTRVAKIAFNPHHHWFFVTAGDGTRLWLPADVAGMGDVARLALRRLPPAVLQRDEVVREVLEELAAEPR
jgi:hypothetical protein